MILHDFQCSCCQSVFERMVPQDSPGVQVGECPTCHEPASTLERVWLRAPGISFGMMSGAVKGAGFYSTDYKNSDLVTKRAMEHAEKNFGIPPVKKRVR